MSRVGHLTRARARRLVVVPLLALLAVAAGAAPAGAADQLLGLNRAPTAVITGPASVTGGTTVAFSGAGSRDPDGAIAGYHWAVTGAGAGIVGSATGRTVQIKFSGPDTTATVQLTVTDNGLLGGLALGLFPASGDARMGVTVDPRCLDGNWRRYVDSSGLGFNDQATCAAAVAAGDAIREQARYAPPLPSPATALRTASPAAASGSSPLLFASCSAGTPLLAIDDLEAGNIGKGLATSIVIDGQASQPLDLAASPNTSRMTYNGIAVSRTSSSGLGGYFTVNGRTTTTVDPGAVRLETQVLIPGDAPSGTYTSTLTATDQDGNDEFCIRFDFRLP